MESQNIKPRQPQDENIVENKELNIWEALIPVFALVGMLAFNVYVYGDNALNGSNQFILLLGAAVAAIVGFFNKVSFDQMVEDVYASCPHLREIIRESGYELDEERLENLMNYYQIEETRLLKSYINMLLS